MRLRSSLDPPEPAASAAPPERAASSAHPLAQGASPVAAERPVRTRFAVGLQLGRMFPTLLGLLRQQYADDPGAMISCQQIAQAVIDGARDRSRDRHLRPLLEVQRRAEPLTQTRRRRRRAPRPTAKSRRAQPPKILYEKSREAVENLPSLSGLP